LVAKDALILLEEMKSGRPNAQRDDERNGDFDEGEALCG
jgi:hypothetical protein